MNAVPFSSPDHNMDDNGPGSDTDSNPDEPAEPISAVDDAGSESDSSADLPPRLPNGYCVDNGVSSLGVDDGFELTSSEEDGADDDDGEVAEEEEEERAREAYDAAMRRAIRENAMNAVPFSSPDHNMDDNGPGSDTDSNPDEPAEYYQPISAADDAGSESDSSADLPPRLPNGYCVDNGVSSLGVDDGFELTSSEEDGADDDDGEVAEEEEEERAREAYDAAMRRAFREDETRRNAPLTPHAATRVMEAMRGVSFGGLAPDWVQSVPEDQWIERLRRLRQPPHASD